MSGNCERIQLQLSNSLESLHRVVQLLSGEHVISDQESFTSSLDDVQKATENLAKLISASTPDLAPDSRAEITPGNDSSASLANKAIDLTEDVLVDDNIDEFDSLLCEMDDEQFQMATSQPVEQDDDDMGAGKGCVVKCITCYQSLQISHPHHNNTLTN